MDKARRNFGIDVIAFLLFVALAVSGFIMRYVLPPGSGGAGGGHGRGAADHGVLTLWGLTRHDWGGIHFWISIAFLAVLALHVLLHWKWLKGIIRGREQEFSGARLGVGIAALTLLAGVVAAPFLWPVQAVPRSELQRQQTAGTVPDGDAHSAEEIRGSMSLLEVEEVTGVPIEYVMSKLGLPANVDKTEQLGRLRRAHGFQMEELREAVETYRH
jgi:hypothetical protein